MGSNRSNIDLVIFFTQYVITRIQKYYCMFYEAFPLDTPPSSREWISLKTDKKVEFSIFLNF